MFAIEQHLVCIAWAEFAFLGQVVHCAVSGTLFALSIGIFFEALIFS